VREEERAELGLDGQPRGGLPRSGEHGL